VTVDDYFDGFDEDDLYDTPEAAALADWKSAPSAGAHVVRVTITGDEAMVEIETEPKPLQTGDRTHCRRHPSGKWFRDWSTG
jgi:hypothetical protein